MKLRLILTVSAALLPAAALAQHSHGHEPSSAPAGASSATSSRALSPALAAEIERVRAATERYRDHGNAVKVGFRLFGNEGPLMGEHWYHPDLTRQPLDLARPSTLQYATIDGKKVLVGVAYTVYHRPNEPVPEGFTGSDDHWHTHDVAKLAGALASNRPLLRRAVNRRLARFDGKTHLSMVHAWMWSDNPDGMFAESHRALPYLRAGLPAAWAANGDEAAAFGASLLAATGCRDELKRVDTLARLDGRQKRDLQAACDRAAAAVHAARAAGGGATAFNRAAGDAWRTYAATKDGLLTREQKQRLASVVEHDMMAPR